MNNHKTNIINSCKDIIVQDDATGLYYFLSDVTKGFYTSDDLRIIANELDSLNENWYKAADKHLGNK